MKKIELEWFGLYPQELLRKLDRCRQHGAINNAVIIAEFKVLGIFTKFVE
jgi:hypothetical protein